MIFIFNFLINKLVVKNNDKIIKLKNIDVQNS